MLATIPHYMREDKSLIKTEDFEFAFDTVLADMFGGGCEIEWYS